MELPEKILLRRGEVMAALGIGKHEIQQMVECNVLTELHLVPNGRAYFKREDVMRLLEQGGGTDDKGDGNDD